ncbi:hypothetical protein FHW89_002351 [Mucilaginibacter sp. SG564]|nr:hypothetical protein [Mucilaginibacter sp. SG564]
MKQLPTESKKSYCIQVLRYCTKIPVGDFHPMSLYLAKNFLNL